MGVYDVPFWSEKFYDHRARWLHYFTQIRIVARLIRMDGGNLPFTVLEVGPSHGLVTSYLRKFGVTVKTLDNKKVYNPDYLSSVVSIPCENNSFDAVLACEVLEHLSFEDFKKALREIHRVSKKYAFITVPDVRHTVFSFSLKLPFVRSVRFALRIPTRVALPPAPEGAHQWEIGRPGTPASSIVSDMEITGFRVIDRFVDFDTPRNHCFLLEKNMEG